MTCNGWKNKNGTAERACKCGTWKQHWLNYSGMTVWPALCSNVDCNNPPTVGAHVINSQESGEWIVPLCGSCNGLTGEFDLRDATRLASADRSITCEKPKPTK